MIEDLNFLSKKLTDSSSYIRKGKMSNLQKIENIKNERPKTLSMNSFLFRIKLIIAPIGDGHGRVYHTKIVLIKNFIYHSELGGLVLVFVQLL